MFKELLSATEQRRLLLLELLSKTDGWSYNALAKETDYSLRTIKNDLNYFKEHFSDLFTITTCSTKELIFKPKDAHSLAKTTQYFYRSNSNVEFLKLLFENETLSKKRSAEKLDVSYSTMDRNIKQVNQLLENYYISVTGPPYQLKGEEHHLRYFFSLFYWSIYQRFGQGEEKEFLLKSRWYINSIRNREILNLSLIVGGKASYFLAVSLLNIRRGMYASTFQSPLYIPEPFRKSMTSFLKQFDFEIPESDQELLMFYFLPYFTDREEILANATEEIKEIHRVVQEYVEKIKDITQIQLENKTELIDQLTIHYVYRSLFRGVSFLLGPVKQMDYLSSLSPHYQSFVEISRKILVKDFKEKLALDEGEEDNFLYWLVSRWRDLSEQLLEKQQDKPTLMIVSEIGNSQEIFLKSLLKKELGYRVQFLLHSEYKRKLGEIDFILTDSFSDIIEEHVPKETEVIRVDYNHFDECVQKLRTVIEIEEKKNTLPDTTKCV